MEKDNENYSVGFVFRNFRYYTRLVFVLSTSVFIFALYYHNVIFLTNEDDDAQNATNQFILLGRDKKYQSPIKTYFYHPVPIASILFLFLIDVLGRKTILQNSLRWNLLFVGVAFASLSPQMLVLIDLCMGLNFSSALISAYLLLTESSPDSLKRLLVSFLFMAWGLSEFFAGFYYYNKFHWKFLLGFIFLVNLFLFRKIGNFFESPEYLKNIEKDKESEEAIDGISKNELCENEVDIWKRISSFDYQEYFKDLGKQKRFLVVLWFNSGLVYNALYVADIQLNENIYKTSMVKGFVLSVAMASVIFAKRLDFWKFFNISVLVCRASLFLLNLAEPGKFMSKVLYCSASVSLIYEIYCLFIVSDCVIGGRAKAKVFGFLIFLALAPNFIIKESFLPEAPSTSQCMWISLFTLSSLVALFFLKSKSHQIQTESLLPNPSSAFELTSIVS